MLLKKAGWSIVPRDQYSPSVSAVAIEEGLLKGNLEADYLLFLEGKAIGVLEAKKGICFSGQCCCKSGRKLHP